jgi:hypothetical protein
MTTTTRRPTTPPLSFTARPKFTLIVNDKKVKQRRKQFIRGEVPVSAVSRKKMKDQVTRVAELKQALGYSQGEKKELWEMLGKRRRRKRVADEREQGWYNEMRLMQVIWGYTHRT